MSTTTPPMIYRLSAAILLPAYGIHALIRANQDGGLRYLKERFGFSLKDPASRSWLHAASVGEVQTVLPLIRSVLMKKSDVQFLVTTTTPTGAERVSEQLIKEFPDRVIHRYIPIDLRFATRRFLSKYSIDAAWVVETEIWPWLFSEAEQFSIPVTIINGRLTQKTIHAAPKWLKRSYRAALRNVTVLARSQGDAEAFIQLGADCKRVDTLGDLKFSDNRSCITPPLVHGRYCIAASTHPDEELQLAHAWLKSSIKAPLVFAPRHPERGSSLHKQLTQLLNDTYDINAALPPLRSLGGEPTEESVFYIADTLGELPGWYSHAEVAFIGGSLINRGGHNMLEAMHAGVPIVVGPHTENFEQAMAYLTGYDSVKKVSTATEVVDFMESLINDVELSRAQRAAVGNAARGVDAIVEKYLDRLLKE